MIFLLVALLLIPAMVVATGNETINILPDSNKSTFRVDSQNFWKNEIPDILGRYVKKGFLSSGGLHTTSSTCMSPSFAVEAFTEQGNRVTADGSNGAITLNYTTIGAPGCTTGQSFIHVAACAVAGTTVATNWHRYGTTNIFTNIVDASVAPSDCVGLLTTTVENGVITKVVPDLTPRRAFPGTNAVHVEEVGGVCDGATDNAPAIQYAIQLATSNGTLPGKVIFSTKNCTSTTGYLFNTGITLRPNLEIDGGNATLSFGGTGSAFSTSSGSNKVNLHHFALRSLTANAASGILIANVSDVVMNRVTIEGRAAGANSDGIGQTIVGNIGAGINIIGGSNIGVIDSIIRANKGSGVVISGTTPTGIYISRNSIENNVINGIMSITTGGHILARDNVIRENGATTPEIRVLGFEVFNFINNTIYSSIPSTNVLEISGGTASISPSIRIDGNYIAAATSTSVIWISGTFPHVGNSVSSNRIIGGAAKGIEITGNIINLVITGNSCQGATLCVNALEGTGTTVLKGTNESLVRKISSSGPGTTLANSAASTLLYVATLHQYTLSGSAHVRIRSNWTYANASGSTANISLVMTLGGNTTAACVLFGITSSGFPRSLYWDIDLAGQNDDIHVRSSSRCGITDGTNDASSVVGGGSPLGKQQMHTALVTIPSQSVHANTVLLFFGAHSVISPSTLLLYQDISVEGLGQ